jgi:hypothetical protein
MRIVAREEIKNYSLVWHPSTLQKRRRMTVLFEVRSVGQFSKRGPAHMLASARE